MKRSSVPVCALAGIVAMLLIAMLTVPGGRSAIAACGDPEELLVNGSFDAGLEGWGEDGTDIEEEGGNPYASLWAGTASTLYQEILDTEGLDGATISGSYRARTTFASDILILIAGATEAENLWITAPTTTAWQAGQFTYTVADPEPSRLVIQFFGPPSTHLDDISVTATRTCPTPTPTSTSTPSPTATSTPASTSTPPPTAIPSPTVEPIPDTTVNLTGDPRFPITGSAAIPGHPGMTYTLASPPGIGAVDVAPNGAFTYIAPATMATQDTFTLLATGPGGETATVTVTIGFVIDKTVPTYGNVGAGTGRSGGDTATDARQSPRRSPTPVADAPPEADNEGCQRCN